MKLCALIIDDEVQIRRLLRVALEGAGYDVHESEAGQLGLQAAATVRPDVILLDLGLPDLDGFAVLKRLREWSTTPVIVLTVRDSEEDKVNALDAGADDYVTKPFSTVELLARLRAAQRRAQPHDETTVFEKDGLEIDLAAHSAHRRERRFISPRPSGRCSRSSSATRGGCSRTGRSCAKSGGRSRRSIGNICVSMSRTCGRRSKRILRNRCCCERSRESDIASRLEAGSA